MSYQSEILLLCDFMLGRLAKWLRILGFDTEYYRPVNYENIILKALKEDRIIITRNSHLSKRKTINTIILSTDKLSEQLKFIFRELKLKESDIKIFSRCVLCNNIIEDIEKEKAKNRVPEYVYETRKNFYYCPKCNKIYWQGTHYDSAKKLFLNFNV